MILADTSAWIEYDRATGSRAHLRLRQLLADEGPIATTEPIVMEVVVGARSGGRETEWKRLLARCEALPFDSAADFDAAAALYRRCRRQGVTPRGLIDCMIAAVAWRGGASLLAHDVDLDRIAAVIGIEMDEGSLRVS